MILAKHARNVVVAGLAVAALALTWATTADARGFRPGGYHGGFHPVVRHAGVPRFSGARYYGAPYHYGWRHHRGWYGGWYGGAVAAGLLGGYALGAYPYYGYGYANCWTEQRWVWRGPYRVLKPVRVCY